MFNLIKMDFYRMMHSVSTWVILTFTVLLAVFAVSMTDSDIQSMAENPQYIQEQQEEIDGNEDRSIGIYTTADPEWVDGKIEVGDILSTEISSGLLLLLCIIFAAIFVSAEQKNGYVKNIAGQFPNRGMLVLSKLAALAVQVLLMLVVFAAVAALTGLALWGDRFYLGSESSLLQCLGVQYLLHLGFAALILFLTILSRSSAFSMVVGLLACVGTLIPVYSLINKIVYDIRPSWNFDISKYTLDGNISMAGIGAAPEALIRAVIVGGAFVVACTILSMLVMQKRDVR